MRAPVFTEYYTSTIRRYDPRVTAPPRGIHLGINNGHRCHVIAPEHNAEQNVYVASFLSPRNHVVFATQQLIDLPDICHRREGGSL
jgi:hypothetical protein